MQGRDVAIVGIGQSDFGALYRQKGVRQDPYALGAHAMRQALDDCGLDKSEIDGLLVSRIGYQRMGDVLGIKYPKVVNAFDGAGRMSGIAVQYGARLVASGTADVVACVYSNVGRSQSRKYGGDASGGAAAYDEMYGMTSPGAYVAMMYRRYAHLYGAPEDALAPLAINSRRNAAHNPIAVMRNEIDTTDYLKARFIAEPLRLFDYCLINDGAVALILTTMERARDLAKRPVRIAAMSSMGELTNFYTSTDFFHQACAHVARDICNQSGLAAKDVDCLQIYDNFTPVTVFSLEGFGVAPRGEGWAYLKDNSSAYDGPLPINTSGGHTSESYMQGWALHAEAVRQVRGEGGGRQVKDCNTAQYICAAPIVTSHLFVGD